MCIAGSPTVRATPRATPLVRARLQPGERTQESKSSHAPCGPPPPYPHEKASEKGIDVQLAIEFVTGALDDAFDIGVVFSADTDLKPALEMVCQRTPVKVEVATRQPAVGYASRISIPERKLWCHYLDRSAFDSVADEVDYAP